jgi:hypothetical protein
MLEAKEVSMPKKAAGKKAAPRRPRGGGTDRTARQWSQRVTQHSDALDLKPHIFTDSSPRRIAASLKRSALRSHRRKADPYRSALSMLTFYINRAGRNLPAARRQRLQRAKAELRALFGKERPARSAATRRPVR